MALGIASQHRVRARAVIKVNMGPGGSPLMFNASVRGIAIYLDHFSIMEFAEGDRARRSRLLTAIDSGRVDLLFSVTNAAELTGPKGRSLERIRSFLDDIGPNWFPVELNPHEVVSREIRGAEPSESCLSQQFMKDYFTHRVNSFAPRSGGVIDLSPSFFRLGPVLDWVCPQRDSIRRDSLKMDAKLREAVNEERKDFKRNPSSLYRKYPVVPFNPSRPGSFTFFNLRRNLVLNAHRGIKKNDGFDYCHAFIAAAFSNLATLDRDWKARIESLPRPHQLAKIYYRPELDRFVSDLESYLAVLQNSNRNVESADHFKLRRT